MLTGSNQSPTCFEMSQVLTSGNANRSHNNVLKMVLGTDGENTAGCWLNVQWTISSALWC